MTSAKRSLRAPAADTLVRLSTDAEAAPRRTGSAATALGRRHRRLVGVLALVMSYMVVEAAAGWLTGSLALLADAAHMLADGTALSLSLFAVWLGTRPVAAHRTYGHYRAEVLAAHANAVLMLALAGYILWEAYQRFLQPATVIAEPMIVVALGGLAVNGVGAWLLHQGAKESLNISGAFLHVLGDLLASGGVVLAGLVLLTTGWIYIDPLISTGIALFIAPRAWTLLRHATDVLLETAPPHVSVAAVEAALRALPGVRNVHDVHVWTITSGIESATAHLVLEEGIDAEGSHGILSTARRVLDEQFGLGHVTLQLEVRDLRHIEVQL